MVKKVKQKKQHYATQKKNSFFIVNNRRTTDEQPKNAKICKQKKEVILCIRRVIDAGE